MSPFLISCFSNTQVDNTTLHSVQKNQVSSPFSLSAFLVANPLPKSIRFTTADRAWVYLTEGKKGYFEGNKATPLENKVMSFFLVARSIYREDKKDPVQTMKVLKEAFQELVENTPKKSDNYVYHVLKRALAESKAALKNPLRPQGQIENMIKFLTGELEKIAPSEKRKKQLDQVPFKISHDLKAVSEKTSALTKTGVLLAILTGVAVATSFSQRSIVPNGTSPAALPDLNGTFSPPIPDALRGNLHCFRHLPASSYGGVELYNNPAKKWIDPETFEQVGTLIIREKEEKTCKLFQLAGGSYIPGSADALIHGAIFNSLHAKTISKEPEQQSEGLPGRGYGTALISGITAIAHLSLRGLVSCLRATQKEVESEIFSKEPKASVKKKSQEEGKRPAGGSARSDSALDKKSSGLDSLSSFSVSPSPVQNFASSLPSPGSCSNLSLTSSSPSFNAPKNPSPIVQNGVSSLSVSTAIPLPSSTPVSSVWSSVSQLLGEGTRRLSSSSASLLQSVSGAPPSSPAPRRRYRTSPWGRDSSPNNSLARPAPQIGEAESWGSYAQRWADFFYDAIARPAPGSAESLGSYVQGWGSFFYRSIVNQIAPIQGNNRQASSRPLPTRAALVNRDSAPIAYRQNLFLETFRPLLPHYISQWLSWVETPRPRRRIE